MNEDLQMLKQPARWPCWPVLPVKRRNHNFEDKNFGVVVDDGKSLVTVYHVNLFMLPRSKKEWEAAPKTEYKSHEEMLADGWVVD
jgi:hypothetical protein